MIISLLRKHITNHPAPMLKFARPAPPEAVRCEAHTHSPPSKMVPEKLQPAGFFSKLKKLKDFLWEQNVPH